MKKLLILMLVLGLASVANATLLFTIDGEEQPPEIWLEPSDAISLDLHIAAGDNMLSYDIAYNLSNAQAELITTGGYGYAEISFPATFDLMGYVVSAAPESVRISATQFMGLPLEGPQILMEDLVLHCLEATDVELAVVVMGTTDLNGIEYEVGEVLHTLVIHQVPEPMTVLLLGLGGVLLRRRK